MGRPRRSAARCSAKEGRAKVTGAALLCGTTWSPAGDAARRHGCGRSGRRRGADSRPCAFDPAIPWDEVRHRHSRPISRARNVVKLIADDQPYLAQRNVVNHREEPIRAARATPISRARAERGRRRHVTFEIRAAPSGAEHRRRPLAGPRDRLGAPDNVCQGATPCRRDDVDNRRSRARRRHRRRRLRKPARRRQLYIEPNGMLGRGPIRRTGVTVWGSMQLPVLHLQRAGGFCWVWRPERIRVVQMETGGGLRRERGIPVGDRRPTQRCSRGKSGPSGEDDLRTRPKTWRAPPKRHPSRTRHRHGHFVRWPTARDGHRLHHRRRRVTGTLSPVRVVARGRFTQAGPYACPKRPAFAARPGRDKRTARMAAFRGFRRAAESVRARAPHGHRGPAAAGPDARGIPPPQFRPRPATPPGGGADDSRSP